MDNQRNLNIYHAWAPAYDAIMHPIFGAARKRSIDLLNLQAGEHVLIPGVGTGLDLPLIPEGVHIIGVDISPSMLEKARTKANGLDVSLMVMNAQKLDFERDTFDAVILNLILSVVPDGEAAFQEAWRVLRLGGRAVIFDKFLPESKKLAPLRIILGRFIRNIGTDPNRRLSDILYGAQDLVTERNESSLLKGQYRIILLRKGKRHLYQR